MKIVIINGSHKKSGCTSLILNEIFHELSKFSDTDVKLIHVADLSLKYCIGCGTCYKTGKCIYNDDRKCPPRVHLHLKRASSYVSI